jgi:GNAT superfamily N-acetyltransferase
MSDMLVKLYDLPDAAARIAALASDGIVVRLAMPYEKSHVVAWVREHFTATWADECDAAFANVPRTCFIAVERGEIVGFACHDATCRNFFGPMGVADSHRARGIGTTLLLACLQAMAAAGYAYAIIGGVRNGDIYRKAVGAVEIAGSTPGVYRDRLAPEKSP